MGLAAVALPAVLGTLAASASAQGTIAVSDVRAQSTVDGITTPRPDGPNGAGYDIRVQATVTGTTWRSSRWTADGLSGCVNHSDRGAGFQTVTMNYQYEATTLRESPDLRDLDPDAIGPSEQVFPGPPATASTLTVAAYDNDACSGPSLGSGTYLLSTDEPEPNEPIVADCLGLDVAVLLDESGSIASAGATQQVRDATSALAEGLVGTGAEMSVFKFSTSASPAFVPATAVSPGFVSGPLATYLAAYDPAGFTNWQAGLNFLEANSDPDLVLFLTDGNPNRFGTPTNATTFQEGYYAALDPAAVSANVLKGEGAHLFAIGVGRGVTDPLSELRLQAVSGINRFPDTPLASADYTVVSDFTQLEEALRALASNLCNVEVSVTKEADDAVAGDFRPAAGFGFRGQVTLGGGYPIFDYAWLEPNAVPAPQTFGTSTQSGQTAADGTLDFVWRPTAGAASSTITLAEAGRPGYVPVRVTCTDGGQVIVDETDPGVIRAGISITGLVVRDVLDCVYRNRRLRSTVRVEKRWSGTPAATTIYVDAAGDEPYDASADGGAGGASAAFAYPTGTTVRVGETTVPAGVTATIDCGDGARPYTGPVDVAAPADDGATRTCVITNTRVSPPPPPAPPAPPTPPSPPSPPGAARLSLTKSAEASWVRGGRRLGFTLWVRNAGTAAANDVRVCDDLPGALSYASAPGARYVGGDACWTIRRLAAGATRTFRLTARALRRPTAVRACNRATAVTASRSQRAAARRCVRVLPTRSRPGGVTG